MNDKLITISEAALTLRVSERTIWRMIDEGRIGFLRVGTGETGGRVRLRASDVDTYLSESYTAPKSQQA